MRASHKWLLVFVSCTLCPTACSPVKGVNSADLFQRGDESSSSDNGSSVGCASDLDCELNGVCEHATATCTCFAAWRGPTCGASERRNPSAATQQPRRSDASLRAQGVCCCCSSAPLLVHRPPSFKQRLFPLRRPSE